MHVDTLTSASQLTNSATLQYSCGRLQQVSCYPLKQSVHYCHTVTAAVASEGRFVGLSKGEEVKSNKYYLIKGTMIIEYATKTSIRCVGQSTSAHVDHVIESSRTTSLVL